LIDRYNGEYLQHDTANHSQEIIWTETVNDRPSLHRFSRKYSYQLFSMLQFSRHWSAGLRYHFLYINNPQAAVTEEYVPIYFAIALAGSYEHKLAGLEALQWNHYLSAGWYQGNRLTEGPGMEWYAEWKESITYRFRNTIGASAFVAAEIFHYQFEDYSQRFHRQTSILSQLFMVQCGVSLSWRFRIVPD
jgi:hypothetical protein